MRATTERLADVLGRRAVGAAPFIDRPAAPPLRRVAVGQMDDVAGRRRVVGRRVVAVEEPVGCLEGWSIGEGCHCNGYEVAK